MSFKKVILFTNPDNKRNLELFSLFNDHSTYKTYVFTAGDDIKDIKGSIVLLCGFNKAFLGLDDSNLILYFARGQHLSSKEVSLLQIIDKIIVESHDSACSVRSQVSSYGIPVPVVKAIPWCGPQSQEDLISQRIYYPKQHKCFGTALLSHETINDPLEAWFCAVTDTYEAIKLMRAGKPVITPNVAPLNELIFHKFNGYLIDKPGDVVDSLRNFGATRAYAGRMARTSLQALLEPRKYIEHLLAPKMAKQLFSRQKAPTWIIKQKIFDSGNITYFPESYNDNLRISEADDFIEILKFFQTRLYSDVYVFGFDFPYYEAEEIHSARLLAKEYGKKGLKIHFCLDVEVPETWKSVFNNISIISVDEGLKQVQK